MTYAESVLLIGNRPAWELKAMHKALTSLKLLNTKEDNERLEAVKAQMKHGEVR